MEWDRPDAYYLRSDCDYFITANKCDGCWRFSVRGPAVEWWSDYRDWILGKKASPPTQAGVRVTYQQGQPQPTEREHLGIYDDVESAKARCEDHWRENNNDAA